jgi:hypothetical protein
MNAEVWTLIIAIATLLVAIISLFYGILSFRYQKMSGKKQAEYQRLQDLRKIKEIQDAIHAKQTELDAINSSYFNSMRAYMEIPNKDVQGIRKRVLETEINDLKQQLKSFKL